METVKNIKPNLVIVKIDETSYFSDELQQKAKKIFGYYLVDLSIITHLCQLTGDYWGEFLYNRFECVDSFLDSEGNATDELTGLEMEGDSMYITGNSHLDIVHKCSYDYDETEGFENYNEFIESVIDYYKSNPVE
jgi:hypothetical protein